MTSRNVLIYLSIIHAGNWDKIYSDIQNHVELPDEDIVNKIIKDALTDNVKCVTLIDEDYPLPLKSIYKPPFVLYYKGNYEILKHHRNNIGVIGSRKTVLPIGPLCHIVSELKGKTIVSGLAIGVDTIGHQSALSGKIPTVAVLGNGLDNYYPISNKSLQQRIAKEGLLLSEYPVGVAPYPSHFPERDRIIAGLCSSIIIGEATSKSGTMITVNYALSNGSDIYVIPVTPETSGAENLVNNDLIKQGAYLITQANDILGKEEE